MAGVGFTPRRRRDIQRIMRGCGAFEARWLSIGAAWLLSTAAGCVELQARVQKDAGIDTSADVASLDASEDRADASQEHDALDVTTAVDVPVDVPADLPGHDMPDVTVDDHPDVIREDRPDAVVSGDLSPVDASAPDAPDAIDASAPDAPDVVVEDHVDATLADHWDASVVDVADVPAADVADVPAADVVDASVNPFPSTGEDGPFPPPDAGAVITLEPRVWNFTTITVPFGTTVRVSLGNGILDLRATGEVLIAGTIDLGGGPGGSPIDALNRRGPGYGGDTATALIRPQGNDTDRPPSNAGGRGGQGSPGENVSCATVTPPLVALGGAFGGGSGGGTDYCFGGAGGGGFAGGAGGGPRGGRGASDRLDLGGTPHASMAAEGGQPNLLGGPLAAYAGGAAQMTPCTYSGGGGSIGESAARDLHVRSTFRPGSGGGGGSGSAGASNPYAGGGGGGGGGALRIASATSILVSATGVIRVDGGAGGVGSPGLSSVGAGGGGSGGVVYLASPALVVRGTISARGGIGALSCARGGNGGIGRIRLSVDPAQCDVAGTVNPPITTGCAPSPDGGVPGQAFVGRWPD